MRVRRHSELGSGMELSAVCVSQEKPLRWLYILVLCPLGWLNYQIYCYYPNPSPATWANARIYCQRYGADLLVIKTQAEYNFIQPYAATIIGSYGHAMIGYSTNNTNPRQ